MKSLHIGISTLVIVALSGCSAVGLGSKRIDYRAGSVQAPALEVPPDLTSPSNEDRYKVPGSEGESVATYSGYNGSAASADAGRSRVLPQAVGVRLEHNGGQQWLVVKDSPDAVWSVVKSFLGENGLSIKVEDQTSGVLETEWAENRASIPEDGLRKLVGKVLDSVYSSGERDQYRVRLARTADNATEVHITHKGMEEVISSDGNTSKWQPRASDPELEAIMLQKLMARFGADQQTVAAVTPLANAPAANGATPAGDGKAALQEVFDGSRIIVINDAFDRSWRKAGLAVERAGLTVEDKDRTRGIYLLAPRKSERGWMDTLMFWQDSEDTTRRFRVVVKDGGAACEVAVTDEDGTSDDTTNKMIDAIYKNIEQ